MSGLNQFKAIATSGGANALTPAAYAALTTLLANGYQSGTASSQQVNTTLRQATFVAAAVAQIIANSGTDANDDGNISTFVTNLLAAINAQGITAPQFDADTSLATTAFVQRALGSFSANTAITGSTTLTALNAGQHIQCSGSGPYTVTLPAASSVPGGSVFAFYATTNGITIHLAGADVFQGMMATSFVLNTGDSLLVEASGVAWNVIGGSASLGATGQFPKALTANGYQKLPSGLILQWGNASTNGSGSASVTFPITFPGVVLSAFATATNSVAANAVANTGTITNSTMLLYGTNGASGSPGSAGVINLNWLAIGY